MQATIIGQALPLLYVPLVSTDPLSRTYDTYDMNTVCANHIFSIFCFSPSKKGHILIGEFFFLFSINFFRHVFRAIFQSSIFS